MNKISEDTTYEIKFHKPTKEWVLWRTVRIAYEGGVGVLDTDNMCSGTKKECQNKRKELLKK